MSGSLASDVVASDAWLIMPVHNESNVVGDVLKAAATFFTNIVCVDDGSRDGSADVVAASGLADVVRHPVNLGQGAALQTGIEYARGEPGASYFVTFDSDGQHDPADAVAMVERLRTEDLDIILGTRFGGARSIGMPPLRQLAISTLARLSPRARRLSLTDAHNGLRAFNRRVAEEIELTVSGMGHASEFIQLIEHHSWRHAELPVTISYTDYSKAKGQTLLNGVNIAVDGLARTRNRGR